MARWGCAGLRMERADLMRRHSRRAITLRRSGGYLGGARPEPGRRAKAWAPKLVAGCAMMPQYSLPHLRDYPATGRNANMPKSTQMPRSRHSEFKFTRDSRTCRPTTVSTLSRPAIRSRHDKSDAGPAFREAANQAIPRWGWRAGRLPLISRRCLPVAGSNHGTALVALPTVKNRLIVPA